MQDLISTALRYQNNLFEILDQTQLPHKTIWLQCDDLSTMIEIIQSLRVRGAPLIGIAASVFIAHMAIKGAYTDQLKDAIEQLKLARPTAVNLMNNLDQMKAALNEDDYRLALVETAERLFNEDVSLCQSMANYGSECLKPYKNILTHCNTGSLATVGVGTALGVIQKCYDYDQTIHVYVDETRPLLQGARLTTWELDKLGISHTLICDNMAASLMKAGKVDAVIVGADRIAKNGDFANKIGTYALAVLANYHKIPFFVAAPYTTIDTSIDLGDEIIIETRSGQEVRGFSYCDHLIECSQAHIAVENPAFDVTPHTLVSAWILDTGVYDQTSFSKIISDELFNEVL
ncbi:S-methyl-5-thioribose-1-phosphate isomerase [Thiotrichales bacterium 19S3-7]|nr:S-methyl-5-thioribose-1-phosphate isomerase [Thiotrichales bacterium 19S3-7]MCF6800621.1 S-methyl-5-thioribose-1-phosphate isomerase [Thiotrichales bacterium 19S3-11]